MRLGQLDDPNGSG